MTHLLDLATTLDNFGADVRAGHTSDDYWAFVGPFGGYTSAVLLRSVIEHPRRVGDPLSLTVNFCAPLAKGRFEVVTRPTRTNRSTQHWSLELTQGGETILTGSAVTTERRESFSYASATPPTVPPPNELPLYAMRGGGPAWVRQYEFRFAQGAPRMDVAWDGAPQSPRSVMWLRDAQPRALDHVALASMADAFFGRIFHVQRQLVPFGTVSLTTHFLGTADEIARQGDAPLIGVADARRFHRSYADQSVELWSAEGALLATGVQVAYFKA